MNIPDEFDRQVGNLLNKQYDKLAGLTQEKLLGLITPLKQRVVNLSLPEVDYETGRLPFVIVINNTLVPTEEAMKTVSINGKSGITKLFPHSPYDFKVKEGEIIPEEPAYILAGIDRGKESINITPAQALVQIKKHGRLPLTIDEGVSILTHFPDFLMKNNCFSLLASRHPENKRVPAIWINSKKHPNLGWCWEGNPHTWLGSASAQLRIGA